MYVYNSEKNCKKLLSLIKDSKIAGTPIFNDEDRNNFYNYLERIDKQIKTPENREKRSFIKR
jgi:L-rhamnose mutarotase